jgi:hypothetical protein
LILLIYVGKWRVVVFSGTILDGSPAFQKTLGIVTIVLAFPGFFSFMVEKFHATLVIFQFRRFSTTCHACRKKYQQG